MYLQYNIPSISLKEYIQSQLKGLKTREYVVIISYQSNMSIVVQKCIINCFRVFSHTKQAGDHILVISQAFLIIIINIAEMGKREIESVPLKYSKVTYETRIKLIEAVLVNKQPVRRASKELGIKFSTAKLIIKRYREDGHIFERKADQEARRQSNSHAVTYSPTQKSGEEQISFIASPNSTYFDGRRYQNPLEAQLLPISCPYIYCYPNYNYTLNIGSFL